MGQTVPAEKTKRIAGELSERQLVSSRWVAWRQGARALLQVGAAFGLIAAFALESAFADTAETAHPGEAVTQQPESASVNSRWTVLAIAPDGSWGVATELGGNRALSQAISNCKVMRQGELGCGYRSIMSRSGWIMYKKCARGDILARGKSLSEAEERALRYEANRRAAYAPGMPPCKLALVIDPDGTVLARALARL